jgi:hypothetical protein
VLLKVEARHKLDPLWKGPFEIKDVQGYNAVIHELEKGNTTEFIQTG